jgi:hypothetical protein
MIFLMRDISGNRGTCQTMRWLASSWLVRSYLIVWHAKAIGTWDCTRFGCSWWCHRKRTMRCHECSRRTTGLSWAGDDDRRLAATMRPCFPRFGAGVEQTPQPGIHARALCGLRLLAHARSDMSTRSADALSRGPEEGWTVGRRVACPSRRKQGSSLFAFRCSLFPFRCSIILCIEGGSVRTTESELHLLCDAS